MRKKRLGPRALDRGFGNFTVIISKVRLTSTRDLPKYCWTGLRRFQNVSLCAEWVSDLHRLGKTHRQNVRKQAEQIRACLLQAREYFEAASAVTAATKPV